MKTRSFVMAAFTVALGLAAVGQAKPNFTGAWKLNIEKSEFGPMPPPTSMNLKIDHTDPDLKVATAQSGAQGDMNYELKYNTEGKETTNTIGPMEAKSTATWEGDDLAINTKVDANGVEVGLKGKWTLSADGKTLTEVNHETSPQGEMDLKRVFEKQAR